MLKIILLLFLSAFTLIYPMPIGAEQLIDTNKKMVQFNWAFVSIKNTSSRPQLTAITRDSDMRSGDQFKFYIQLKKPCYVYLIYYSSTGDLRLLFPPSLDQVAANASEYKKWYVPDHNNWFELTGKTGDEKFILLASLDRLKELESSLREYEEMDQTKRKILAPKIIADIQSLRRRHFDPKTTAEKPVSMIGNVRDVSDTNSAKAYDIANFAVEISAEKFYGKTFTIYHRK